MENPRLPGWARYMGIGLTLAVTIMIGLFAGYFMDKEWDTRPWLTLTGFLVGSGIGFYNLVIQLRRPEDEK